MSEHPKTEIAVGVGLALMFWPPLGVAYFACWALAWLLMQAARGLAGSAGYVAGHTGAAVGDAYRRGKAAYTPPQVPRVIIHEVPDSRREDQQEAERRYLANVQLILASRLSNEMKEKLIEQELKVYEGRLKQLLQ